MSILNLKRSNLTKIVHILPKRFVLFKLQKLKSRKLFKIIFSVMSHLYKPDTKVLILKEEQQVYCCAFSPDNNYIATASECKIVNLYCICPRDSIFGSIVTKLEDHLDSVKAVLFSNNGEILATGSWDKTTYLYSRTIPDDMSSWKIIHKLSHHQGPVVSLSFSSCNKYFATGSRDKTARIFSINEYNDFANPVYTVTSHSDKITTINFNSTLLREKVYFASGACDRYVNVLELNEGNCRGEELFEVKKVFNRKDHTDGISSIIFSPDDEYLLSGSFDKTVNIYSFNAFKSNFRELLVSIKHFHTVCVKSISFNPTGTILATAGWDELTNIFSFKTKKNSNSISYSKLYSFDKCFDENGWINFTVFSPRLYFATCGWNRKVEIYI